jgi:Response regulator containing a CheY-like receiver domain and an HTH DNA-binding domain
MAEYRDNEAASGGNGRIRFLIVDDHPHGREGMRDILEAEPRFAVVGEASSGEAALEAVERLKPDIVLMDVNMPGMGGLEAAQIVKRRTPDVRIVMVTAHDEPAFLFEALRCGAQGFLPKNVRPSVWLDYLRAIANDETPMSSEIARMLLKTFTGGGTAEGAADPDAAGRLGGLSGADRPARRSWLSRRSPAPPSPSASQSRPRRSAGILTPLTAREREVLELVAGGESNREIAARLGLSEHTVKNHLKNILQKLHLDNRVQLARYAYESGIVGRDENRDGDEAP